MVTLKWRKPTRILASLVLGTLVVVGSSAPPIAAQGQGQTSAGTSTGGGITTGTVSFGPILPQRMEESKAQTTYWRDGSNVYNGTRHVLTLWTKIGGGYPTVNNNPHNDFWSGTLLPGWTHTTVGTDVPCCYELKVGVTGAAGFGQTAYYVNMATSASTSESALGTTTSYNVPVPIQLSSDGELSGASFKILTDVYHGWHKPTIYHYSGGMTVTFYEWNDLRTYDRLDVDISKLECTVDASIDSRRMHGQPNEAGELPGADPNAPARPINFGGWIYKGGLFAGNMPWSGSDLSGTSRIQLKVPSGGSGDLVFATLAMHYQGRPSTATTDVDLGVFLPDDEDENIDLAENLMRWDNKWYILPRATAGSPPDYTRDPLYKLTFNSSTTSNEYVNWFMTSATGTAPPSMALSRLIVAMHDEDAEVNNGTTAWRYFTSKEMEGQEDAVFPTTDGRPRVWRLGVISHNDWQ